MIDAVLGYSKVPVTIQSYDKDQSYAKYAVVPSDQKDKSRAWSCTAASSFAATTSEDVPGLKTNPYEALTIYGKLYPLKALVCEEIYLGRIPKLLRNVLW